MPYTDFQSEEEALKRRREALMAAMQQNQQTPIVGNTGLGQALAQVAASALGGMQERDLGRQQQSLSAAKQASLSSELQQYLSRQSGQPELPQGDLSQGPPQDPSVLGAPAVPADPRRAVLEAMASQHPELKAIGAAGFKEMQPRIMESGGRVVQVQQGQPAKVLVPAKPDVIGSQAVAFDEHNRPTVAYDGREKYSGVGPLATGPDGKPIMGATVEGTNKPVFAPAGSSVQVDLGQGANKAFANKIGEGRATEIQKSFEIAKELPQKLATLDEASGQLQAGIKSGLPADIALTFARAGKALGLGDVDPTVANTETFRAKMAGSVLDILKVLRPASDKDVQYAEKAAGGQITLDAETMSRLIDSARAAAWNSLHGHAKLMSRNKEAPGAQEAGLQAYEVPYELHAPADRFDFENGTFRIKSPLQAPAAKTPATGWSFKPIGSP